MSHSCPLPCSRLLSRAALPYVSTLLLIASGCSVHNVSYGHNPNAPDAGGTGPGGGDSDASAPPPCQGLACQHSNCGENQAPTSISGVVYDPAGNNPLYNVVVFIPNSTPQPLPSGASCDTCASLYTGDPIAVALTDAAGKFTLNNVPDGNMIPLVVQIGKWRRQLVIPTVVPCQNNALPDKSVRLPRNQQEGDIPRIAISTGGADTLECLLVRVGIDRTEYSAGAGGTGRIHIFQGSGRGGGGRGGSGAPNTSPAAPSSDAALWASQADLMPYDMVLLSCEGAETTGMNQAALHAYASGGGRVFASHFHYAWFNTGPYGAENLATWFPGSGDLGNINAKIVTSFPKGMALDQWLGNVNALSNGELPISAARHNASVSAANTPSQAWIVADQNSPAPGATEYFSFNMPTSAPVDDAGVRNYCGRVVFSDLHVGAASGDYGGGGRGGQQVVPTGCASGMLSPQEKALEFMLFDLSSCVMPDDMAPQPPIG